jgi:hypothetical protein
MRLQASSNGYTFNKTKPNLFVVAMEVYGKVEDDQDVVEVVPKP